MTVSYKGKDSQYERSAEIWYDDENVKERYIAEYMIKVLPIKGWKIISDWCFISAEVDDINEYKLFVSDYKAIRRTAELRFKSMA